MVEERITDGVRIAELLSSEVSGREGDLADLAVVAADPDAVGTVDGERAYDVARDGDRVARAFVHESRVRLEIDAAPERSLDLAADRGLRARPRATEPPRTILFVESGAEVKPASDVLAVLAGYGYGDRRTTDDG